MGSGEGSSRKWFLREEADARLFLQQQVSCQPEVKSWLIVPPCGCSVLQYKQWCSAMDQGKIPSEIKALLTGDDQKGGGSTKMSKSTKNSISSSGQG